MTTQTTNFLLRPLGLLDKKEALVESKISKRFGFINAYLMDKDHENIVENPVYLLFKPRDMASFDTFINEEYEVGMLKEDYDYEGGYTVLVYEFPKPFINDYKLILQGKYSRVSQKFKDAFPKDDINGIPVVANLVLNKDPRLKFQREQDLDITFTDDMELWSVIDMADETLDITKIKQHG